MKNKLFWPIILVAVVVIVESVILFTGGKVTPKNVVVNKDIPEVKPTEIIKKSQLSFYWINSDKPILMLKADDTVSIDAIDLYISYKGGEVLSVKNLGDLPKPSFQKISKEKSLVVLNYLVSAADGLKLSAGQEIKVLELEVKNTNNLKLSIDSKTQVVENGSAKVLPFNSQELIINSSL